jgi:hypothetical protein
MLKALEKNPVVTDAYAFVAMAHIRKGDRIRSRAAVEELLRIDPKYDLSSFEVRKVEAFPPAYREFWTKKLLPAWRLAGLPE